MGAFLEDYFGYRDDTSIMSVEATRTNMMSIRADAHSAYFLVAARVLFRNHLLDILADVLDVPHHADLACVPRSPKPTGTPEHLDKVCGLSPLIPIELHCYFQAGVAQITGLAITNTKISKPG